jgi:Uma2 family endonuclease
MIATAAAASLPFKTKKKRLTYEDYARLTPPDSGNFELHDGQIIHMASPTPLHQDIAGELYAAMLVFAKSNDLGKVYIAPLDTLFDRFNTFQPDVLFISKERLNIIGDKKIEAAPDLVVEVLSGGNTRKEMLHKRHTYEAYGVREYWLINPEKMTLVQYIFNQEEEEFEQQRYAFEDEIESAVMPGFRIKLSNLLA